MLRMTMALVLLASAQEPAKARPSLEETIRVLYRKMRSEDVEEQRKAIKAILPGRKDIETLFPKQGDAVWAMLEIRFKAIDEKISEVAKGFRKGGEITEIKLADFRTAEGDRNRAVLEMIPKDIPAYDYVIVRENGRSGGGDVSLRQRPLDPDSRTGIDSAAPGSRRIRERPGMSTTRC
jgi:hypothetical protein